MNYWSIMAKLRLYVDPAWKRRGMHSPLMNPWWGNPNPENALFTKQMFDAYQFDTSLYDIVDDLHTAQFVFVPYRQQWCLKHDPALWQECLAVAKRTRLPLLIDGMGDIEPPLEVGNAYVLRSGGYRFIPEPGRIVLPLAADDLLERECAGQLRVRQKSDDPPVVGFAGWAQLSTRQRLRTLLKELPIRLHALFDRRYHALQKGVLWRERALAVLRRSAKVRLNALERSSFSANAKTAEKELPTLRKEMVETLLVSDYCLDVRGDANNSTRLWEILSLGRIPVILDTERNLPFREAVEYSSFSLIVDFKDIERLDEIIAQFHSSITAEAFETMQCRARAVFLEHFRIDAHMRGLMREIGRLCGGRSVS